MILDIVSTILPYCLDTRSQDSQRYLIITAAVLHLTALYKAT